jgi:hypothetical protein
LNTTADGSLLFSVRDLIAWDAAVRRRAVLKPESWSLVLEPVRLASGKPYPYGFGWFLEERGGAPLQQHGGSWQGFKTQYSRFLGEDLSVFVLANLAQTNPARFADGIAAIINPALAVPVPQPIEDREPQVTAKLARLLEAARDGALAPAQFAYIRAGFFPAGAKAIQEQLRSLGTASRLVLVERLVVGDDRIYRYEVTFGSRTMYYTVALAPDDRIASFGLRPK